MILGLGIETSCDETSIAIVKNGSQILCNLILSQDKEHSPFQGVVPELASRTHVENINSLYDLALKDTGLQLTDMDYIAVSCQPGLIGSLMIGGNFAKCLHLVAKIPIYPINHIEGHFYAPCLEGYVVDYPSLGLILSGGNSAIYKIHQAGEMELLVQTLDDACGEAFDKVGNILGLGYPAGRKVEQLANQYRISQKEKTLTKDNLFPPLLKKKLQPPAFSFSGIKTAVVQKYRQKCHSPERISYDFQFRCFELVINQLTNAIKMTQFKGIIAGGGVLANRTLRSLLDNFSQEKSIEIIYPRSLRLCTDNAAMIAALGYHFHCSPRAHDWQAPLTFSVSSKSSSKIL